MLRVRRWALSHRWGKGSCLTRVLCVFASRLWCVVVRWCVVCGVWLRARCACLPFRPQVTAVVGGSGAPAALPPVPLVPGGAVPFPPMLCPPSIGQPFMFVHLPKNAGSTVRDSIMCVVEGRENGSCSRVRTRKALRCVWHACMCWYRVCSRVRECPIPGCCGAVSLCGVSPPPPVPASSAFVAVKERGCGVGVPRSSRLHRQRLACLHCYCGMSRTFYPCRAGATPLVVVAAHFQVRRGHPRRRTACSRTAVVSARRCALLCFPSCVWGERVVCVLIVSHGLLAALPLQLPPPSSLCPHVPVQYMPAREAMVARNGLPPDATVPCLTFIRRPAERLLSLYYYFLQDSKVRCLAAPERGGGVGWECVFRWLGTPVAIWVPSPHTATHARARRAHTLAHTRLHTRTRTHTHAHTHARRHSHAFSP
jgi:hypothetical protein